MNEDENDDRISAIIIDDEPLAREGLMLRLEPFKCIEVKGVCASANDAIILLKHMTPDVIFLDIEMPGLSGMDFAQWMQSHLKTQPKIIFVTAFREFALKAFDFEAFDYLLKPFADERLLACVSKLKVALRKEIVAQEHDKLDSLLQRKTGNNLNKFVHDLEQCEPGKLNSCAQTISLKSGTEWLRIKLDSIYWIEAAGDYMCIHTQEGTQIIRKTLKELEADLDSDLFKRVNRSAIINLEKLIKLTPNSNGEYIGQLSSGDKVKVSRKYKYQFDELSQKIAH